MEVFFTPIYLFIKEWKLRIHPQIISFLTHIFFFSPTQLQQDAHGRRQPAPRGHLTGPCSPPCAALCGDRGWASAATLGDSMLGMTVKFRSASSFIIISISIPISIFIINIQLSSLMLLVEYLSPSLQKR